MSLNSRRYLKKIGLMIDVMMHLKKEIEHDTECGKHTVKEIGTNIKRQEMSVVRYIEKRKGNVKYCISCHTTFFLSKILLKKSPCVLCREGHVWGNPTSLSKWQPCRTHSSFTAIQSASTVHMHPYLS